MTHPHEKTYQFIWTGIILSFFLIQAVIWTVAITLTANDTSHHVIPNYEQLGVNWDSAQAEHRASQELGWTAELTVNSESDIHNVRQLELMLQDRDGQPIDTRSIKLDVFHTGRASVVQPLTLTQTEPGRYTGQIRIDRSGMWQFSGRIENDATPFLLDQRLRIER